MKYKSRKTEYLLVDGYNIIFAWEKLAQIAEYSLGAARQKLCDILCDYQGAVGLDIILVFDAHLVEGNPGRIEPYQNITVVFTREAETADHYIEQAAKRLVRLSRGDRVTVATSDRLEQVIIMSQGARRLSARDLQDDIRLAKERTRERYLSARPVKNNPLAKLLDAETAKKLEALRQGEQK